MVTYPTGEQPSPADSGHLLVRWARDVLRVPQAQIVDPAAAIAVLLSDPSIPLLIIDDFAGSGDQFMETWTRKYAVQGRSSKISFADIAQSETLLAFYVAPIVTWKAAARITSEAPQVRVRAAHQLSSRYSALDQHSVIIPADLRADIPQVIADASARGQIPRQVWFGWNDLALALAFSHTRTDGSLGLFWHGTDTWKALIPA
jgi:hypothetical protein